MKSSKPLHLLKPQTPKSNSPFFLLTHHLCTNPISNPNDEDSIITQVLQVLQVLQPNEQHWNFPQLHTLLFPSSTSSPSPRTLLHITRCLASPTKALKFFDFVSQNLTPQDPPKAVLSSSFEALVELTLRQPPSETNLYELYKMAKDRNVPISPKAVRLLVQSMRRAGMEEEALLVFNELDSALKTTFIRNEAIGLLLKMGRVDDALKVLDEMLDPEAKFQVDDFTVGLFLSGEIRGRSVSEEEIVEFVSKFGERVVFPNSVVLTKLVSGLCRNRKVGLAWDVLHDVMKKGGALEAAPCNALLSALGRGNEFERMRELMAKMEEMGIKPDVITFGILINRLCKSRRIDAAMEVFEKMSGGVKGVSVEPGVVIYSTLIDGLCKVGRQEEGLRLMEKMRSQSGCAPDTVTYNILIDGFNKVGDIEKGHELFDKMKEEGIPMNVSTLNTMLDGLSRRGSGEIRGRSVSEEEIVELVSKFGERGVFPNSVVLTKLVSGLCRNRKVGLAWDVLHDVMKKGGALEAAPCNALLSALGGGNEFERMRELMAKMEEMGIKPDVITFGILINWLCKSRRIDAAMEVFEKMSGGVKGVSVEPDVVIYSTLIDGLCKVGRQEEGLRLMEKMRSQSGCAPDTVTYNILIDGFNKVGDIEKGRELFDKMKEEGIPMDVSILNTMLDGLSRRGSGEIRGRSVSEEEIVELVSKLGERGVFPNSVVLTKLVSGLCRNRKVGLAWDVLHDVMKKGGALEAAPCNALLSALGRGNEFERMRELMAKMEEMGIKPDVITFGILINRLCKSRRIDAAMEVFEKMSGGVKGVSVEPDVGIYSTLIDGLCKVGRQEEGLRLMEKMRSQSGCAPDTVTYNILIDGFNKVGDIEKGRELFDKMKEEGIPMNVSTLNTMLDGLSRRGSGEIRGRSVSEEEIVELVSKFGERGVFPNSVVLTKLVSGLCRNRKVGLAWDVLHDVMKKGGALEAAPCNALLSALGGGNEFERMRELMAKMEEMGIKPDVITFGILINWLCKSRRIDAAMEVFEKMSGGVKGVSVEPDVVIYSTLIDGLCKVGRQEEGLRLMEKMRSQSGCAPNTITYNILIDGFNKVGDIEKGRELFDKMKEEGIPMDVSILNTMLDGLSRRGSGEIRGRSVSEEEIVELVSKLGERGVFPNSVVLTKLVSGLCRNRKVGLAWDVLHDVMKKGGALEAAPCNALLSALGRGNEFERMRELMAKMEEMGIKPDVITFGILINRLCKSRRIDAAMEVFEKMSGGVKGVSVEPDVGIYSTLIDGLCKVGRQEEGLRLMEKMRSQSGCAPDTVTYNILIDGFNKVGDIEKGRELFDKMKEEGIPMNVSTLNTMLDGLSRRGRLNTALEFFNEMERKGLKGDFVTYTILITSFCNVTNIHKAMELFDQMLTGCPTDAKVYRRLISGLSQAGRMEDASFVVSKLKEAGFSMDIVSYNVMIHGFCSENKPDKIHEMIEEMEASGVKPDSVTYNTLLAYLGKHGDIESAYKVFDRMLNEGVVPTVVTFGTLIHAHCLDGDIEKAMRIFRDMGSKSKMPPNTVIYSDLINSLCKKNDVEQALSLMEDMKAKGVRPDTQTFSALFKGLRENNLLKKAFQFMDQMVEEDCNPDYITMDILTEWLPGVGETERLRKFAQGFPVLEPQPQQKDGIVTL